MEDTIFTEDNVNIIVSGATLFQSDSDQVIDSYYITAFRADQIVNVSDENLSSFLQSQTITSQNGLFEDVNIQPFDVYSVPSVSFDTIFNYQTNDTSLLIPDIPVTVVLIALNSPNGLVKSTRKDFTPITLAGITTDISGELDENKLIINQGVIKPFDDNSTLNFVITTYALTGTNTEQLALVNSLEKTLIDIPSSDDLDLSANNVNVFDLFNNQNEKITYKAVNNV
jgi:hypothetical protein